MLLCIQAFLKKMSSKLDNKAMFKGKLDTYRFCDNVRNFAFYYSFMTSQGQVFVQ